MIATCTACAGGSTFPLSSHGYGDLIALGLGVVSAIAGLAVLFGIKPRLLVTFEHETCHFVVQNVTLSRVVKVEAQLWAMSPTRDRRWNREKIPLKEDRLFSCNGTWRALRRSCDERKKTTRGDTTFRFVIAPPCGTDTRSYLKKRLPRAEKLPRRLESTNVNLEVDKPYLLLQIWSDHSFTNFGRLHLLEIFDVDKDAEKSKPLRPRVSPFRLASYVVRKLNHQKDDRCERKTSVSKELAPRA